MEIDKNVIEEALAIANDYPVDGDRFDVIPYWKYAGRGMYGATCFGVVARGVGHLLRFIVALASLVGDDAIMELMLGTRHDALGLDAVYYWFDLDVVE